MRRTAGYSLMLVVLAGCQSIKSDRSPDAPSGKGSVLLPAGDPSERIRVEAHPAVEPNRGYASQENCGSKERVSTLVKARKEAAHPAAPPPASVPTLTAAKQDPKPAVAAEQKPAEKLVPVAQAPAPKKPVKAATKETAKTSKPVVKGDKPAATKTERPAATPVSKDEPIDSQVTRASVSIPAATQEPPLAELIRADAVAAARPPRIPDRLPKEVPDQVARRPVAWKEDPTAFEHGPKVRLCDSKRILLNFEVKNAEGDEQTAVDLWYTRDRKTWRKADLEGQNKSPYLVEVPEEGVFGFTVVANGGQQAPQTGEPPQVWVEADLSKPVLNLLSVEVNALRNELAVFWKATDKNFGPRPITLYFAAASEGPWQPFATNIENAGTYLGRIPGNGLRRFFVKIEATDLVGHVAVAQTPKPVVVATDRPSAAITDVLPTSSQEAPAPAGKNLNPLKKGKKPVAEEPRKHRLETDSPETRKETGNKPAETNKAAAAPRSNSGPNPWYPLQIGTPATDLAPHPLNPLVVLGGPKTIDAE